ncbi:MAG: dockerin type I repeat-containing protein [Oscillospiraceae bacterium]|nr:dockerin type I repeat-containing protein [Oscillospiraceae bacterium]
MKVKSLIAGISAMSMTVAMATTAVPAFAEEMQMTEMECEMQAYVASIEDGELQQVAAYLSSEGVSLEETKEIMARCENSKEQLQETFAAQASGTTYFHSTSALTPGSHPCLIFMRGSYVGENNLRVDMTFPAGISVSDFHIREEISSTIYPIGEYRCFAVNTKNLGLGESVALADCKISSGTSTFTNEKDLVKEIKGKIEVASDENKDTASFAAVTYRVGDIDHDGVITDNDAAYLSYYLAGTASFGGSYYDVTSAEAKRVMELAADVDHDGNIDQDDLTRINRYLAGQITTL